jgi:hypothetical protein
MKKLILFIILLVATPSFAGGPPASPPQAGGSGDMTKAVYDTGDDGSADTANALAANGANCAAGLYPLGVDVSGAVESCTDVTTEIDSAIATHSADTTAQHGIVNTALLATSAAVIANNSIVRGDGGAYGVQSSGVTIDDAGMVSSPGTFATTTADGGSAIAWDFADPSYTTVGAKMLRMTNNGDEVFSVDYVGKLHLEHYVTGGLTIDPNLRSFFTDTPGGIVYIGSSTIQSLIVDSDSTYHTRLSATAHLGFDIVPTTVNNTVPGGYTRVKGGSAVAGAAGVNQNGGDLELESGDSIAGGTSGDIIIDTTQGAGSDGAVVISASNLSVDSNGTIYSQITKASITDDTTTDIFTITVPSNGYCAVHVMYTASTTDATDYQAHSGEINLALVNKGGTVTCDESAEFGEAIAVSAGTYTSDTWSCADDGTSPETIEFLIDSSLNSATTLYYSTVVQGSSGCLVTPL